MSHVADVIVMCSLMEETVEGRGIENGTVPALDALNNWLQLAGKAGDCGLVSVNHLAGGYKAMQAIVSAGAFNYLDIPAFLSFAWSLEWESRDCVQIMIKDEQWDTFKVYTPPSGATEHG